MNKGPTLSAGFGCGILLIPIFFIVGGWGLGKIAAVLTWAFG
jgi:hypothetical protein